MWINVLFSPPLNTLPTVCNHYHTNKLACINASKTLESSPYKTQHIKWWARRYWCLVLASCNLCFEFILYSVFDTEVRPRKHREENWCVVQRVKKRERPWNVMEIMRKCSDGKESAAAGCTSSHALILVEMYRCGNIYSMEDSY